MSKEIHLGFIQGVINRHNSNSFMLKGWTITIAAALYALAGTIKEPSLVLISLVPILLFWGLDSFYLSNERCFIDLYNAVVLGSYNLPKEKMYKEKFDEKSDKNEKGVINDFNMNFKKFEIWKDNSWCNVLKSKTIFWFYFSLFVITLTIWIIFSLVKNGESKALDINATLKSNGLEMKINNEPPTIINNIYPYSNTGDSCKSNN